MNRFDVSVHYDIVNIKPQRCIISHFVTSTYFDPLNTPGSDLQFAHSSLTINRLTTLHQALKDYYDYHVQKKKKIVFQLDVNLF